MICDHIGCKNKPARAPRLIVPSQTWLAPGHKAVRVMTTLHYCELHKGELEVGAVLDMRMRTRIEVYARQNRPIGFKPDFDKAFIEYVLMTTPEYRQFLVHLGYSALAAA